MSFNIKKGIVIGIILILVGSSSVSLGQLENKLVAINSLSNGSTLYVGGSGPGNYSKIQGAINDSSNGDTVYVYSRMYYENVIVNKSIDLIGENKTSTVIDGRRKGDTVHVIAKDVTLSGFTIKNGSLGNEKNISNWYYAGIRLTASNSIIYGNILWQNTLGIFGKKVTNITIFNNEFIGDGVTFSLYDVDSASTSFCRKYFIHTIYNNTVNGKPLVYLVGESDKIIDDAGQIILVSCTNMTIRGVNLTNADFGCILVNCSKCLVKDSNISSGDGTLWLIHSNNNRIQNNRISHNFEGVCLDCKSTQNFIISNTISNNDWCGIIVEDGSNFNKIIKNNFIENKYNAFFYNSFFNRWARNYWSDWPGIIPRPIFGLKDHPLRLWSWLNWDWFPAIAEY